MRLIDADALIDRLDYCVKEGLGSTIAFTFKHMVEDAPTIDAVSVVHGNWEEKETFHNADDNPIIEEWQSARCSVCGKYHTTPYMYYFDNFNFCPNCGNDMRGADDE